MSEKFCSVSGCRNQARWRGMCGGHYTRWRRHGILGGALQEKASPGEALAYLLKHMHDECPKWPFARSKSGYGKINIEGRTHVVSRVVCEMVNGPAPSAAHEAAHNCGRGNQGCFGARCLQWKTHAENMDDMLVHGTRLIGDDHPNAKLTNAQAEEIRRRALAGERPTNLAREFGIAQSHASGIKHGLRRSHLSI